MRSQRGGDKGVKAEWSPLHRRNALGVFAAPTPLSDVARHANALSLRLVLVDELELSEPFLDATGNERTVYEGMTKLERGRFNDWFGSTFGDFLGASE